MARFLAIAVFLSTLASLQAAAPEPAISPTKAAEKGKAIDGKVVALVDALKKLGAKPDADTAGIAFVAVDGTVYSLVKDDKSRLLFLDKSLLNRDLRLTARVLTGTQILQVDLVQTVKEGKAFNVDYFCDQCQLEATEPGACKCCGRDTVLRELPAK